MRKKSDDKPLAQTLFDRCGSILLHPAFDKMKSYCQHGDFTTYDHVLAVTFFCLKRGQRKKGVDLDVLLPAALLHDYFLYDWHDEHHPEHHATQHAYYASINALREFDIPHDAVRAILTHMYPLPFHRVPKGKEAWVLWHYDKVSAFRETFGGHPFAKEREELEELIQKARQK